ncbi:MULTISPECIES: hypothetical protein [Paenibacillus]|nr:hypothetical protein [Paenibacillus odorifer]
MFEKVSLGEINLILKSVSSMTFRQLVLLKILHDNKNNLLNLRSGKLMSYSSEQISIQQELYELTQMGFAQKLVADDEIPKASWSSIDNDLKELAKNPMYGWAEVVPAKMQLTHFGDTAYRLMGIKDIDDSEVDRTIAYLS